MVPIPIGSTHTARTVDVVDLPHVCASCGRAIVVHTRMRDRERGIAAAKTIQWFSGEPPDHATASGS